MHPTPTPAYLLFSEPKAVPTAPAHLSAELRNRIITAGYAAQAARVEARRLAIKADVIARMGWSDEDSEQIANAISGWASAEVAVRAAFHESWNHRHRLNDYVEALLAEQCRAVAA